MPVCAPAPRDIVVACVVAGLKQFPLHPLHHVPPEHASLHAGIQLASPVAFKGFQHAGTELWLEFGAASGITARILAAHHHVHSFDSFHGLPELWRGMFDHRGKYQLNALGKGAFGRQGKPPFPDGRGTNITWHVGMYSDTVQPFMQRNKWPIRLVHVDCDLYSSTSTVFNAIAPRLAPGALLVFDELINYPEFEAGEMRALAELMQLTGRPIELIGTAASVVAPNYTAAWHAVRNGEQSAWRRGYWQNALVRLL